jgi:hypothetical protein
MSICVRWIRKADGSAMTIALPKAALWQAAGAASRRLRAIRKLS